MGVIEAVAWVGLVVWQFAIMRWLNRVEQKVDALGKSITVVHKVKMTPIEDTETVKAVIRGIKANMDKHGM